MVDTKKISVTKHTTKQNSNNSNNINNINNINTPGEQ